MNLFWLSQNGEDPAGPLLLSQLRAMARKGQLTAEAVVCEDGSEDWQPVTTVLGELPSDVVPQPALGGFRPASSPLPEAWTTEEKSTPQKEPSNWPLWVMAALLALGAAAGVWFCFFAESHESAVVLPTSKVLNGRVRQYIQSREPSGDVSMDNVGPALPWSDGEFRVAHYMIGGSPQNIVIRLNPRTQEVTQSWSPGDWSEEFSKTSDAEHYPGTVRIISDAAKADAPTN